MKFLFVTFVFITVLLSDLTSATSSNEIITSYAYDFEERAGYPGLLQILRAVLEVVQSLVAYLTGQGSVDDITKSIQGIFFEASRMFSVQGVVGEIPIFGFVLQPLVGIIAMVLSNAPLLGGIISIVLVGMSPE